MNEPCRLCGKGRTAVFAHANDRDYLQCRDCQYVFVIGGQLPDLLRERAEYALHNNDPADQGYRRHLAKLTEPLLEGMAGNARGLDFGCGPGPTISVMLGEKGYDVANYDPAFFPDMKLLSGQYDFVTCTEVVEHFHNPAKDFELLFSLLKPGGRLGVMTRLMEAETDFSNWYYAREISHVGFFNARTMGWLAEKYHFQVAVCGDSVAVFSARNNP
jgi:SAM-dependent methyltransferase